MTRAITGSVRDRVDLDQLSGGLNSVRTAELPKLCAAVLRRNVAGRGKSTMALAKACTYIRHICPQSKHQTVCFSCLCSQLELSLYRQRRADSPQVISQPRTAFPLGLVCRQEDTLPQTL